MNSQQRINHVLRRFAFGASPRERERYRDMNLDQVIESLLNFDGAPADQFDFMRLAMETGKDAEPGFWKFRQGWMHALLTTDEPLRERLALFWHSHFAVRIQDVEHGLALLQYMQSLREVAGRPFPEILERMCYEPALLMQLNVDSNRKGAPNENFGRELLELHTVGIGNYGEGEVLDAARAFTGVSVIDTYWGMGENNDQRLAKMKQEGRDAVGAGFVRQFHDTGEKSVMGLTGRFGPDELIAHLAMHRKTAENVSRKLWQFFASPNPNAGVVAQLADVWMRTKGDIKAVLRTMAKLPEFYGVDAVGTRVKSPIEFEVNMERGFGTGVEAKKRVNPGAWNEPIHDPAWSLWGHCSYQMNLQGFNIFEPPSVAGWNWDESWISTNNLAVRSEQSVYGGWRQAGPDKWVPDGPIVWLMDVIRKSAPDNAEQVVQIVCRHMDAELRPETMQVLAKNMEEKNIMVAMANRDNESNWFGWTLEQLMKLIRSTPEYQLI